jgi:hypothetical protein
VKEAAQFRQIINRWVKNVLLFILQIILRALKPEHFLSNIFRRSFNFDAAFPNPFSDPEKDYAK